MENNLENCWEYMQCGREPGGKSIVELGVCAAATDGEYDGTNNGKNAGRFCWAVTGTLCKGEVQGHFAAKFKNCILCSFFQKVQQQEERAFVFVPEDIGILGSN